MKIKINKTDLSQAVKSGILNKNQIDPLWKFLNKTDTANNNFNGINVTYYFGALVTISAMTWLATEAFSNFSSKGLMLISVVYFFFFLLVGKKLYAKPQTLIPGGLLLTTAVFMTPLFIFSIQHYFGLWGAEDPGNYENYYQWVKSGWFFMEIGTIAVSILFLYKFKFPFLSFPLAFTLWFLSMDLTPIIFGISDFTWDQRKIVSLYFGLAMLVSTYFIDRFSKKDYAFWLYLFGLLSFWGGLSLMNSDSEFAKFIYFSINITLILIAVLFRRKVFLVFGSLGSYGYLYHLSSELFKDSIIFPLVLSLFGILIIFTAIKYAKNAKKIENYLLSKIPANFKKLLPRERN